MTGREPLPPYRQEIGEAYRDHLTNTGGNDPVELMMDLQPYTSGQPNRIASTNSVRFTLAVAVLAQVDLIARLEAAGLLQRPRKGTT